MWIVFGLVVLFAVGCARIGTPNVPKAIHFQLDSDSPFYPLARRAAALWSRALDAQITVTPDGDIPIIEVATLNPIYCGVLDGPEDEEKNHVAGCAVDLMNADRRIELTHNAWGGGKAQLIGILHEMGHVIARYGGHLENSSHSVMDWFLDKDEIDLIQLTPEDVAFVTKAYFNAGKKAIREPLDITLEDAA